MKQLEKIPFIYLVSHSYSGSTLISMLLGLHPEIATVGELTGPIARVDPANYLCSCGRLLSQDPFWRDVTERMNRTQFHFSPDEYFNTSFYLDENPLLSRIRTGSLRNSTIEKVRDEAMLALWPGHKNQLKAKIGRNEALVQSILDVSGKRVFLDASKDPMRLHYLLQSQELDVCVIHLERDVRGVVNSIRRRRPEWSVEKAARSWRRRERDIRRHLKVIEPSRKLLVHYEEIACDTLATLNRICQFLEVQQFDELPDFRSAEQHVIGNSMRLREISEIRLDERWRLTLSRADLEKIRKFAQFSDGLE